MRMISALSNFRKFFGMVSILKFYGRLETTKLFLSQNNLLSLLDQGMNYGPVTIMIHEKNQVASTSTVYEVTKHFNVMVI